jgi:hypothetical protein
MKRTSVPLTALLAATLWVSSGSAQQPPPAPPQGAPPQPAMGAPSVQPAYSGKGAIKAFNLGPNGETDGLILSDGTAVFFPSETGETLRASIREGSRVAFTGVSRPGAFNRLIVDAQTISANGRTFTAAAVPPPPGGGGRGGREPGPAVAGAPPPSPAGCPAPPPPPGPGR